MLRDWQPNDAVKAEVEDRFRSSYEFCRRVPDKLDWDRVSWVDDLVMATMWFRYSEPDSVTMVEGAYPSIRNIVHTPAWAIDIAIPNERLYQLQPPRTFEDDLAELIDAMVDPTRPR